MPISGTQTRKLGLLITAVAISSSLLSGCGENEKEGIGAGEVCGGLSKKAATSLEELTTYDRYTENSLGDVKKISRQLSSSDRERHLLCTITPVTDKETIKTEVSFKKVGEVPPEEPKMVGIVQFPDIGLRATSYGLSAAVYFRCRGEILLAKLSYPLPGHLGSHFDEKQIRVIQDLAYKVAQELNCPDNGSIPKV